MEYIKKTLDVLRLEEAGPIRSRAQSQDVQRPNVFLNSLLAKLPTEILEQIVDSLPIISAVAFSLSCKPVYSLIGTKHLEILATTGVERREFLELLEKDLPDQIFCESCQTLHKIKDAKQYTRLGDHLKDPACLTDYVQTEHAKYMIDSCNAFIFSPTIFKMVMKHYRHFGKDRQCLELLNLLSGIPIDNPYDFLHHREKAECRIYDSSLIIGKQTDTLGTCISIERNLKIFRICSHISLIKERKSATLRMELEYPSPLDEKWEMFLPCSTTSGTIKSEIQQCRWCRTEYMATFEHRSTCEVELTVTVWQDLGPGLDADSLEGYVPVPDIDWDDLWEPEAQWKSMTPREIVKEEIASSFEKGWPGEDQE